MIRMVCAIVFLTFVFLYLYFYQADVLALTQHIWSGGETRYNNIVGASLITVVLYLIQLAIGATVRLPHRAFALSFAPSLLLLGALTSATIQSDGSVSIGFWTLVAAFMIVVVGFVMKLLVDYAPCESPLHGSSLVSQTAWYNYGLLGIMFLVVFCMGNNDRQLHTILRMEREIIAGKYSAVLDDAQEETTANMTMLRAYALSKSDELGERLFEYPLKGGSRALLPSRERQTLIMPDSLIWRNLGGYPRSEVQDIRKFLRTLESQQMARKSVDDYMLTAYLLDKDLTGFAREIAKVYDFRTQQEKDEEWEIIVKKRKKLARLIGEQEANDSIKPVSLVSPSGRKVKLPDALPRHYREALILYNHLHSQRVLTYEDNAMNADYDDFIKMHRTKYKSKVEHDNKLKTAYFGTYWWYYYQ